jgi:phage recombination protein Bet
MSQAQQIARTEHPSLIRTMASKFDMEPVKFAQTVKKTCISGDCSDEDFAAFLMVAKEYDLNPIIKEIFAFPKRGGGIQPIVSVDGWVSMINRQPSFNGLEFEDKADDKGELVSITCRMYRKDRDRPISVTEYMSECRRATDTWKQWPARMLRHKAMIQCARYAFGFSGIMEPDEYERSEMAVDITPRQEAPAAPTRGGQVTEIRTVDAVALEAAIKAAPDATELSAIWATANRDGDLLVIKGADRGQHDRLCEIYNAAHAGFAAAANADDGHTDPEQRQANDDAQATTDACLRALPHLMSAKAVNNWFATSFQKMVEKERLSPEQIARVTSAKDARLAELQ